MSDESVPKLICFDLDGLTWELEMYLSDGAPFKRSKNGIVTDCRGNIQKLYEGFEYAVRKMRSDPRFAETKICAVSRTFYPEWAASCMRALRVDNESVQSIFDLCEIYPGDKKTHFAKLREKTGNEIAYEDMLFFDNEPRNTRSVAQLGVTSILEPYGLTNDGFERGLSEFAQRKAQKK